MAESQNKPAAACNGRRETESRRRRHPHQQQQPRRVWYNNRLSGREMESLVALCDTFLPSLDPPPGPRAEEDSVRRFYRTSASMAGTPHRVGGLLTDRLEHPLLVCARLALLVLSTCVGTLLVCGRRSLSPRYPFLRSFSQVPVQRRGEILLSWTRSIIPLYRMFFSVMKLLVHLTFFNQVDENGDNASWEAIGYCGPDPDFRPLDENSRTGPPQDEAAAFGPLHNGLIYLQTPPDVAAENLRRSGFPASACRRRKDKPPSVANPSLVVRCDAVVVGSGSGGGVVAGILAKAGYKVLVVEKGNYFARSSLSLLEGPAMDQMYLRSGLLTTKDTGVFILAGSTVGGGSAVNWSASLRTPYHVMREWCEEHGVELFGSEMYREAMDAVCGRMGVQSEISVDGFSNAVLRRGCLKLGYPVSDIPRNSPPDHGCGWCCFGCKDGKKKGTPETWLADMVDSGNGRILPECEAIRVLHRRRKGGVQDTAAGVAFEYRYEGATEICVVESKVTVVACGAIETPVLLRRSGLRNPHIGRNLHLHPVTMAWGYFPETEEGGVLNGKKSYEGAIMTAMSSVVADFKGSGYGAVIQTPSLHPGLFSAVMPWVSGAEIKRRMCRFSRTAHIFALARDRGAGAVSSPSSISYPLDGADEASLQRGVEKLLRILAAAGAEEVGTSHCGGRSLNVKAESSYEFERFVWEESGRALGAQSTPLVSAHQMGSCRMGAEPGVSAVRASGETWEVEGLFVADSSVFPTALGVNPMVTVQAIAYCTAQSILEALRRKKSGLFAAHDI